MVAVCPVCSGPAQSTVFRCSPIEGRATLAGMAQEDLFQSHPPGTPAANAVPAAVPTGSFASAPLAARMRPRSLAEYVGQSHILAPGMLLRRAKIGRAHV